MRYLLLVSLLIALSANAQGIPKRCLDYADKQQRAAQVLKKTEAKQKDVWAEGIIQCMEAVDKNFGAKASLSSDVDINMLQQQFDWACTDKNGTPLPRKAYELDYCQKKAIELDQIRQTTPRIKTIQ